MQDSDHHVYDEDDKDFAVSNANNLAAATEKEQVHVLSAAVALNDILADSSLIAESKCGSMKAMMMIKNLKVILPFLLMSIDSNSDGFSFNNFDFPEYLPFSSIQGLGSTRIV
jgi:hypothetical protein